MKNLIRILVCVSLLASSAIAFAGTLTFYLLNSAGSVENPITITKGSVKYFLDKINPPECRGEIDVSGIKVSTGEQTTINVDTSTLPASCWNLGYVMVYDLSIEQVDGKGIDSECSINYIVQSPLQNKSGVTIEVTETKDHFFCNYPSGFMSNQN